MAESISVFVCPERNTPECISGYRECSQQRLTDFRALDELGKTAAQTAMESYVAFADRHASWQNQSAIKSLVEVFQSVAVNRYNSINPEIRIVCKGSRTLLKHSCTAQIQQT